MASMSWSKLTLSDLAVASLVAVGLFVIAIGVPPLFNPIFGEEPTTWAPEIVANGALYVVVAALVARGSRIGFGLALVLGMLGFAMTLGLTLSWLGLGYAFGSASLRTVETLVTGLLAAAHAVVVVGAIHGALRRNLAAELDVPRRAAAALLAGVGFTLSLGSWGGAFAIMLTPIEMPGAYEAVKLWVAIPHFVAFAAITLNGRFATIGSLVVGAAGFLLGVQVTAALVGFGGVIGSITASVALWTTLTIAWAAAGLLLLAPMWTSLQATSRRPAPVQD
jgi:hypothetical protein